ncbi:hypothetical protein SHIRM173S_07569 [Streptomyces hirsutus]
MGRRRALRADPARLLFKHIPYEHSYPHCWRCHTALLYYAQPSWYIRTTAVKDRLLEENEGTNWFPDSVKHGRYGDWLNNNIDWALSRNRYWGTPLPIWRCEDDHLTCVGSLAELTGLTGTDQSGLDPHRPFIDAVTFACPQDGCGKTATRVPEVIDAWYDSGSMPFAQWGYPHKNKELFESRYPAQFICEAIDQTRGWFYTLMAVGTLVFDKSSYENVVCLGHILAEDGRKMSKHLGNTLDPVPLMDQHGADAVRWFMAAGGSPWAARRVGHGTIQEVVRKTLLTYWNTVAFQARAVLALSLAGPRPCARVPGGLQGAHRDAVLLLRVPLQGVRLGAGVPLEALGTRTRLADDLVGLGTGLGDRLVGGLLGQREHTGRTVAAGAALLSREAGRTAHGATGAAHGAAVAHLPLHLALHRTALAHLPLHLALHRTALAHLPLHLALHRTALAHLPLHLALHRTALAHLPLHLALHRTALAHGAGTLTHRAGTLRTALTAGAGGQLRRTARQLGRTTHGATHLLLRRARYAGGHRTAGTSHALLGHPLGRPLLLLLLLVLRFRRLAHVLLVLGSSARGRGQFGAQVLVLSEQARQFGFDLIEEGIDLVLVIAFSEADGRELLVPHVLGGQRHLFTST